VTDLDKTIKQIKESSEQLEENSKFIVDLTESISATSNQANLLALNAMIEVAKSGGEGKALVELAEEISALAAKSAGVASGISDIVNKVNTTADDDVNDGKN
jgi:methyl-accepting chemotaxis protein